MKPTIFHDVLSHIKGETKGRQYIQLYIVMMKGEGRYHTCASSKRRETSMLVLLSLAKYMLFGNHLMLLLS